MKNNVSVWGLVPFFYSGSDEDKSEHVVFLKLTIMGLKKAGVNHVIVVDDCSGINLDKKDLACELLLSPIHTGKTGAVLFGLRYIIEKSKPSDYIIQCDYDADQNSEDAKLILRELQKKKPYPAQLVIGDRYRKAQPDPLMYRKVMLRLQKIICKKLGYDLEDTVSGLRGYTIKYAKKFFAGSKAKGFGSDTEQLIIAYLANMIVTSVPLTYSRRRSISTPREKLIDVMNAVFAHEYELKYHGNTRELLNLFGAIRNNLQMEKDSFRVGIDNIEIEFSKEQEGMYTAVIF